MLRIDAEENSCPDFVLTLTSSRVEWTSREYGRACATFWQAFRRRFGRSVEYCGFVEWTTGEAASSGGERRMHTHWLVKAPGLELDPKEVEAWVSGEWRKLTGAWVVQFARLEHAGGVVGYLALHHEKIEQAPPAGWTGRRLRPSKGYFAVAGDVRRARARLWLAHHREQGSEHPRPYGEELVGRIVWGTPEWEKAARAIAAEPGRSFDSLPARRGLEERLRDPDAPRNLDELSALARFERGELESMRRAHRRKRLRELELSRRASFGGT